jgi:predicted nucleic acid-binding protein
VGALTKYYIDTNAIIALLEMPQALSFAQKTFIKKVANGSYILCSSQLALAECLVKPLKLNDVKAIRGFLSFFDDNESFQVYGFDKSTFLDAAKIRAELGCKMPDAMHVASALQNECRFFITNDLNLKLPSNIERAVWSDFKL